VSETPHFGLSCMCVMIVITQMRQYFPVVAHYHVVLTNEFNAHHNALCNSPLQAFKCYFDSINLMLNG